MALSGKMSEGHPVYLVSLRYDTFISIVTTLNIRSLELIHFITGYLYPLTVCVFKMLIGCFLENGLHKIKWEANTIL